MGPAKPAPSFCKNDAATAYDYDMATHEIREILEFREDVCVQMNVQVGPEPPITGTPRIQRWLDQSTRSHRIGRFA